MFLKKNVTQMSQEKMYKCDKQYGKIGILSGLIHRRLRVLMYKKWGFSIFKMVERSVNA